LVITFQNRDLKTFEYIKDNLKFGEIKRISDTLSKLVVYNFELKYILVPLFLKNNLYFLTENRIKQFNLLLYTIENNIKKWEFLPDIIPNYHPFNLNDTSFILSICYFKNWLVGFVTAEGSFYRQKNKEFNFNVSQLNNIALMQAIHLLFDPSRNLYFNDGGATKLSIMRMSSVKDIQKVIDFFSRWGLGNHHPLVGYKKDQYIDWLENLKKSDRYKDLKYPTHYFFFLFLYKKKI
jgi:hypothetical protein